MSVEVADIAAAGKRAKESGQVEKTAGESGVAGTLRNKFVKWLESVHGKGVQKRLEDEGGAPIRYSLNLYTKRHCSSPGLLSLSDTSHPTHSSYLIVCGHRS